MKCPFCGFEESKVIDSRPTDEGQRIRRRRECLQCAKRFTTYERIETVPVMVIKKDKTRERFDREKLLGGLLKACEKRPVEIGALESTVNSLSTIPSSIRFFKYTLSLLFSIPVFVKISLKAVLPSAIASITVLYMAVSRSSCINKNSTSE